MTSDKATSTLDEEYKHLHPHAFHLHLPSHHKTDGGIPYATIDAHRKGRAIVKLANGLVLKEEFFVNNNNTSAEDKDVDGDDMDDNNDHSPTSLHQLSQQAQRLHSQLSKFCELNYRGGITQLEICDMFLKVLNLLCATVEIVDIADVDVETEGVSSMVLVSDDDGNGGEKKTQYKRKVIIHYDDVGHILNNSDKGMAEKQNDEEQQTASTEEALSHPFALPAPTRQSLLNVAIELIGGKKDTLRGVSNSAITLEGDDNKTDADGGRTRLIISHQALLRMLIRTTPYLDEHKLDTPPKEANGIRSGILKKSVSVIRACRRFFDQGALSGDNDATARQLWSSLQSDLQFHTHSNSAFRALILLYLFHPSKCSSQYYKEVLPTWLDCWRNIDRCPEWDYLWMVMFDRARKYFLPTAEEAADSTDNNIWNTLRASLLTSCAYWLQIPVGGVSADKLFPNSKGAFTRSFPARLKVFVGINGRYEEGMDFVRRLTKLLMFCCATTDSTGSVESTAISAGTSSLLSFLSFITPYFNPSNQGGWTFPLGAFLHYLAFELCARVGVMAGWKVLKRDHSNIADELVEDELYLKNVNMKSSEIVALLDKMVPLCQQALYSKNPTVSHCGETALLYLAQIDPIRSTPPLIDFSMQALDISSVNLAHQAPVCISTLSRLLQPSLRAKSSIILSRLPDVLRLSLAGIDGNDQNKSLRTLVLYRNLVMWMPVGGPITLPSSLDRSSPVVVDGDGNDGTLQIGNQLMDARYSIVETEEYKIAIEKLPQSSILIQQQVEMAVDDDETVLMQEAMMAMSDWSLMFLDRVYDLMRNQGEQEKLGKGHGGVGLRHTSADVAMTKNFSRIMKETLIYFFAGMDETTYTAALRSVVKFFDEETLPFAVKDASLLCQAVCSTRFVVDGSNNGGSIDRSPGLDALVPILTEDLQHKSSKAAIYRLRCLSGAVRYAGSTVLKHREAIMSAISFALSKVDDRVLFKTGCKLLRHTLSSQCEEYPISQCYHPMRKYDDREESPVALGKSALLRGDKIWWHVPSGEQLDFTVQLLSQFTLSRWNELGNQTDNKNSVNLQQWRQTLRVLRYTLRGCAGILLDEDPEIVLSQYNEIFCPKEMATAQLVLSSSEESRKVLNGLRKRICSNLMDIMCLIAKDTVDCESKTNEESEGSSKQYKKNELGAISSDAKILSEIIESSELLLARRGAQYQTSSGKTIYRGLKEIMTDHPLASTSDFLSSVLARCNDEFGNCSKYKDGEDAGKTVSRVLLVNRIHLCNQDLTANASSQVPRRLRKLRGGQGSETPPSIFTLDMTLQKLQENLSNDSYTINHTPLEVYEGLIDGLCALSCHPNINIRSDALSTVDFAFSRFGWVVKHNQRPLRLLAAISLNDEDQKGVHGIPSCSLLVNQVNTQGKRSRLAEVVKGVIKLLATPKILKEFHWSEINRFELVKTLCGTQKLLQLVPQEEVAKIVHYINSIFLSYRSKFCTLPRATREEQTTHDACLSYLLGILQEGVSDDPNKQIEEENDTVAMHWRDRLIAAWFVLKLIDEVDLVEGDSNLISQVWSTVKTLLEEEVGQPLQRVSLGLLGRLVSLALVDMSQVSSNINTEDLLKPDLSALRAMFLNEKFCHAFSNALVFDHREDTSVGGGHSAQWSSGVEEVLRDAGLTLARRTLFPFNRISNKSVTFKLQHSQLIETVLLAIGHDNAKISSKLLLDQARELVASPPSEDQRNQHVTSAEIFSGCSRALIQYSNTDEERDAIWETILLPFLEEAVVKMPTNIVGAFNDAIRYAIHHFPPSYFFPALKWTVAKVRTSLWQNEGNQIVEEGSAAASTMDDRFALQGKWLLIFQAVLVELDYEDDTGATIKPPFYSSIFDKNESQDKDDSIIATSTEMDLGKSWTYINDNLTPVLLNSISHPYEKCRDHIAAALFRMCYCQLKFINIYAAFGNKNGSQNREELSGKIVQCLVSIRGSDEYSSKEKNRALGTARKFLTCCVHWGDAKHEYSEFIIPLIPLVFQSLQTIEGEVSPEDRGMEAELVKGYRYAIADISSSCVVNYGVSYDMTRVLDVLKDMSSHDYWQIRQASAHFLRNFQGAHKFLFSKDQEETVLSIAISLLDDDRREVSSAATSTLTGILTMLPQEALEKLASKYIKIANRSLKKKKRKVAQEMSTVESQIVATKEKERATRQQKSVFVLCAIVMGRPYDVPSYVPEALAALSKHSFEQRASLGVREVVRMVFSEFKKTHTDNWVAHRKQFTQEQLEAMEDVVSTPHYYA